MAAPQRTTQPISSNNSDNFKENAAIVDNDNNNNNDDDDNDDANNDGAAHVQNPQRGLQMRKNLGLIPGISYVAGGIIGVGIFVSPQKVLLNTGQSVGVALCVWAFCALLAFCGALCYAELGSRISKSGGTYTFIRSAFGDGLGFLFLWTQLIVVRPMSIALAALTMAEYALRPVFMLCPDLTPKPAKILIALCVLGLPEDLREPFSPQGLTVQSMTLAVYSCTYAYMGWDHLTSAAEEVKNPKRNVPIATLLAVLLTAALYLMANVSYHAVLTTPQIVSGITVAAVFTQMTVPALMWLMVPCIAASATGIVNVNLFSTSRMNFTGGRDGLFPEVLSMISVSRKTPLVSCLFLGVVAGVVIAMAEDISSVIGAYSFFRAAGETVAILGLYRLRRKHPASHTTYVVPTIVPVFFLAVSISLAALAITRDTSRYIVPLVLTLSGIPVYLLSRSHLASHGPLRILNDFLVLISRKLLLCDFASKEF